MNAFLVAAGPFLPSFPTDFLVREEKRRRGSLMLGMVVMVKLLGILSMCGCQPAEMKQTWRFGNAKGRKT
jgi:hypothetical protein